MNRVLHLFKCPLQELLYLIVHDGIQFVVLFNELTSAVNWSLIGPISEYNVCMDQNSTLFYVLN